MAEFAKQNYEWLIIFLVYNNNYYDLKKQDTTEYYTMEEQTKYILNQIRYTKYSRKVKTVFVEAEIKNNGDDIVATISMLRKKEGTWLSSVDGIWRERESPDLMTNTESLTLILDRLQNKYKANKHMIVTAGHGSVIGINYYIPELKQNSLRNENTDKIIKKESAFPILDKNKKTFVFDPGSSDANELLFLSNKEISDAIKNAFPKKKIDVLIMYNCLMQNLFTQFEFKEKVDWLIAPLSGISIPGFNYGSVLNEISTNPDISSEMVAELFVNSIRGGNSYPYFKSDIEGTWKISAMKLDQVFLEKLQHDFEATFEIINALAEKKKNIINTINKVIKHLFSYSVYCLRPVQIFDLGSFLASLSEKIVDTEGYEELRTAIDQLQNTLNNNRLNNMTFTGKNFYTSEHEISHYDTKDPNLNKIISIGVFLPITKPKSELFTNLYDEQNPPTFLKSTSYAKVVNKLYKLIPMNV